MRAQVKFNKRGADAIDIHANPSFHNDGPILELRANFSNEKHRGSKLEVSMTADEMLDLGLVLIKKGREFLAYETNKKEVLAAEAARRSA
jgi:hypothetical protein